MKRCHVPVVALGAILAAACGSSGGGNAELAEGGDDVAASSSGAGLSSSSGGGSSGGAGSSSSGASSSSSSGSSSSGSSGSGPGAEAGTDAGTGSSSGTDAGSSSGSSSSGGADAGAIDYSVYQHHKNGTRDGVYVDPAFTRSAAATTHALGYMGTVSTSVYAQPLYVESGPGGVEAFVVATEQNHVTTFNASTGAVIWDKGPSVIGAAVTGGLQCAGDINPLGITGTPIIKNGVIYFDAMTTPDGNTTAKHLVYAMNLSDGSVPTGWPVDVNAKVSSFTSHTQNQRGALQLVNGVLYVSYGGIDGDCGTYYGWVVGFPLASPQSPTAWHTAAVKGGIWGTGSLPTDGTSIFPVTGNTSGTGGTWGGGEAVIRLAAGPTFSGATADYYAPSNWLALDNSDADLGGASEVLFDMPGAATPHLVAAGGKDGNLYVLNRDDLGGIGHEVLKTAITTHNINGALAVYTTSLGTYAAFHIAGGTATSCPNGGNGNVVAVKITAGTPFTASVAWCATQTGLGSPMVTTTNGTSESIVWAANNHLWGFNGDTGAVIAGGTTTAMSSGIQGFNTPIAAKGRIAVGVNGQLYVFAP
jgi:hypothetical protein